MPKRKPRRAPKGRAEPQATAPDPAVAESAVTQSGPAEPAEAAPPLFPVVGIGASAGGVEALQTFFAEVKPGTGLAFVVVQHLDPDHRSVLAELIGRVSQVPVAVVEDGALVEHNRVYVIPPNATLTIEANRLHLSPPAPRRGVRVPIDTFFASLAEDHGELAACVILSGTGSDGTIGLRVIKERGGLTLAQEGAQYDGMMLSALATGLVDYVLPAGEMPAKLSEYFRHLDDFGGRKGPDGINRDAADSFTQVCALLRTRTGHDFSGYKDKTIIRRVQRRMQVLQIDNVPEFLERLRKDPHEVDALFQDLLIGVTGFFRDPNVFETLERVVIPRLFEGKSTGDTVRVWVPGCSTGEEAYTIAMLLREHLPEWRTAPKLQIFASDIDQHSLEVARTGRYPATITTDLPSNLLARYMVREDGTYRVIDELREICLFTIHNLLHDAPFSKLDLISCRNLLIYLNPDTQDRLIPLFHYALRDGGYLFLGTSENVTKHSRLFSIVDKDGHIFKRRPQSGRVLPEFPLTARNVSAQRQSMQPHSVHEVGSAKDLAERLLLDHFSPAYVVINSEGEVLHASARTGKYLELPAGPPNNNIFSMARSGLRLDLRAVIHKAVESGQVAVQGNLAVVTNGGQQSIDLIVEPVRTSGNSEAIYMVVFRDIGCVQHTTETERAEPKDEVANASVRQLEADLRAARERLQTTTEELESSNEELKSSNEELTSINEELQSSNEELETSKEELQSINEELQTVNAELKARVEELSRANSDIANLLESTQIATVFLDRQFAIKSFTPAAKDVFRLVESDVGRPLSHIRSRLRLDMIHEDVERVLRTLGPFEEQVESEDGSKRYIVRILPYRTVENVINGVVLSFVDVTRITAAEREIVRLTRDLRDRVEALETLLDVIPVGVFIASSDTTQAVQVNRYGARLIADRDGQKGPRPVGVPYALLRNGLELPFWDQPLHKAVLTGRSVPATEAQLVRSNNSSIEVMMQAEPLFDEKGGTRGSIAAFVDVSDHKKAEVAQNRLLHELQHRVKNILATVASLSSRMLSSGAGLEEFAEAFQGRLLAMGRLNESLSQGTWESASLNALAGAVLGPYFNIARDNVILSGPDISLGPREAMTLGMALYELASNAAKYGALSVPHGIVELTSTTREENGKKYLSLVWRERNGPRIEAFPPMGFGTRFIVQSIDYELEGVAKLTFDPEGCRCTIDFPLHIDRETTPTS